MSPLASAPYRVVDRRRETRDTVSLTLAPAGRPIPACTPGQFVMVYAFGIGEVPLSVSGDTRAPTLVHTVRAAGAVTRALHDARPGELVGVRGPFGVGWREPAGDGDLLLVGGGIGLAPLRPLVLQALADRARIGRVVLLVGARTPDDLIYRDELAAWRARGVDVQVTVDRAGTGWAGPVGVVTTLVDHADFDAGKATAFVCGPEVMMRFTARSLMLRGMPPERIRVSLERNMRCGVGWCGHCQLGPLLLCRDGPVVDYAAAGALLTVAEL